MTAGDTAATASEEPAWIKVPDVKEDDIWIGEMTSISINGKSIILLNAEGELRAYANRCPHQDTPLDEGMFEDGVLTCSSHLWEFDVVSGAGINPSSARLMPYDLRIDGAGQLYVMVPACRGATDCQSVTSMTKNGS